MYPLIIAALTVGVGLAFTGPAMAAGCPQPAAAPAPATMMPLQDILRLPRQPNPALEKNEVTTVGYLMHIREVKVAVPVCGQPTHVYRLFLSTGRPKGLKGVKHRHRALAASIPVSLVRSRFHGIHGLKDLVGKRVRVTGRLTYMSHGKPELMWTRGSPWELRGVSEVAHCTTSACTSPAAASPATVGAAQPPK